jgi:D-alanine-D-alanine ligase-like ATP-grasp enzyme
VNHNENVLSFYDKYDYSSNNEKRLINPLIDKELENEIKDNSIKIFKELNLCGLYRFDIGR